jgi:hypothetical protein
MANPAPIAVADLDKSTLAAPPISFLTRSSRRLAQKRLRPSSWLLKSDREALFLAGNVIRIRGSARPRLRRPFREYPSHSIGNMPQSWRWDSNPRPSDYKSLALPGCATPATGIVAAR